MARALLAVIWVLLLSLPLPSSVAAASDTVPSPNVVRHAPDSSVFDCATIWKSGFPRKGTGLAYCLEHARETIGGAEYRVLYPSEWATEAGWGEPYLDIAMDAIRESITVYGALGLVSSANIVFSPKQTAAARTSYADTNLVEYLSDEPCAVVVYPLATDASEEAVKQTLAHELFHCFQNWNFPEQSQVPYAASGWWKDAAADYFSNVVYPATNNEWSRIGVFDATSGTAPLTRMTYEASFFFQHLGNTIGDAGIIDLLGSLPGSGGEIEQQAALRAWPGMDNLFQEFAEDYLDTAVTDTSGDVIPFSPEMGEPVRFAASDTFEVTVEPFVVRRRLLAFDPKISIVIGVEELSGDSRQSFRPEGGSWAPAPIEISCSEARNWRSAITSVGSEAELSAAAVLRVQVTTSDECDEPSSDACLQGAWAVRDYEAFMVAALAMAGADTSAMPITFEGASGGLDATFGPDTITYAASDFELRGSTVTQGMAIEVTLRFSGTATVTYEVTSPGTIELIEVDPGSFTVSAETAVGGSSMGTTAMDPLDWILFATPTYGYTCSKTALTLTVPPSTVPVVFAR